MKLVLHASVSCTNYLSRNYRYKTWQQKASFPDFSSFTSSHHTFFISFTSTSLHFSPFCFPSCPHMISYPDSHFIQMLDKIFFQKINKRWNIFLILSQLMTFTCYCRFSEWSTQERKGKKIPSYMFLKYHKRNNVWISQPWIVRNCKAIV